MASKNSPLDVDQLLAQAAQAKKPAKGKSKAPVAELKTLEKPIAQWLKAKQDKANAEAAMTDAEKDIIPAALGARKEACRAAGKFDSSIVVNGALQVSWQNKYSNIPLEEKPTLDKAFGDDVDKYFTKTTEIKLTEKAVNDPETVRKIIEAVGIEKFKEVLEVKQVYKPTEAFHHGCVLDEAVDKKAAKLIDDRVVKPYKAALKQK